MGRMKLFCFGAFLITAVPAAVLAEPSRDQAVLNAILRVETRYLEEDRRDPNFQAGQAEASNTVRKAKHLDKLLALEVLNKDIVLDAYRQAEEKVKSAPKARDGDRARFEALRDLVKELRIPLGG